MEADNQASSTLAAISNPGLNVWSNLNSAPCLASSSPDLPSLDSQSVASRVFDVLASISLISATVPLMIVIAFLIYLDSAGPIFYYQERLGLRGQPFTLIKFRSMRVDAEVAGPAWASIRDQRVTRVGRFLRLTRIDELPQLWNVLRGEMALIGPRPERAHFAEQLTKYLPQFPSRLMVKPGITGWSQVNLPYGASIEDARAKLAYDLYYINNRSVGMTLNILIRTIGVMVSKGGR